MSLILSLDEYTARKEKKLLSESDDNIDINKIKQVLFSKDSENSNLGV